jgi:hypothetical protein
MELGAKNTDWRCVWSEHEFPLGVSTWIVVEFCDVCALMYEECVFSAQDRDADETVVVFNPFHALYEMFDVRFGCC